MENIQILILDYSNIFHIIISSWFIVVDYLEKYVENVDYKLCITEGLSQSIKQDFKIN